MGSQLVQGGLVGEFAGARVRVDRLRFEEIDASVDHRLARAIRGLRDDTHGLVSLLTNAVAPSQRQQAHITLVRELGASRAADVWLAAFGQDGLPMPISAAPTLAAAPPLDERTSYELARARHLEHRLEHLLAPRSPQARSDSAALAAAVEPNVSRAAIARLRRSPGQRGAEASATLAWLGQAIESRGATTAAPAMSALHPLDPPLCDLLPEIPHAVPLFDRVVTATS